ncbi:hypothetical protein KHA94_19085 [Bacillus sp. FJAT-49705]|uniref:Uncharacterized protein n=1 Tax=Cytobacillus citreus TaxID=2833586 RepID=A0ABS5NWQ6_9BACI|nr:hypothetical protein [Cytobacillus citreus]MBS4192272.1 hypothetical protein [Cytobacillus citreus]
MASQEYYKENEDDVFKKTSGFSITIVLELSNGEELNIKDFKSPRDGKNLL